MKQKIKNFFLKRLGIKKKKLIFALLCFAIFSLIFSFQPALAQVPGFSCAAGDLACYIGNFVLSVMLKIVVLISFGMPLFLSALFVAIMGLILGWIISPHFISLKFTQNPFVDIGLSITKNFANMGFIVFLVAIALATALRIEEYKAKKTLPTLIMIALLINFSPVFCGFIIDASNIVMNFFLSNITGIAGFVNILYNAGLTLWNLLITSGFDIWANIAAAMQLIISIVFNFFAGFIFILFSALFIMRYIMLWILVILSPVAFVSYILPITRRGRSLLSWRSWWEQLIAWAFIGITAGFFLYLGFTMISMINAAPGTFVTQPDLSWDGSGLGLMNNILPYLIPLVLLWIAYRETRRTSAMFAREIIEMPEKVAKSAVTVAAIAATAGAATAAAGATKGALGTLSSVAKFSEFEKAHPTLAKLATPIARPMQWARRGAEEKIAPAVKEGVIAPVKERAEEFAEKHPEFSGYVRAAGRGLKTALLGTTEKKDEKLTEEQIKGGYTGSRGLESEEIKEGRVKLKDLKKAEVDAKWTKNRKLTDEEIKSGHTDKGRKLTEREIEEGWEGRELTEAEIKRGWIAGRDLTKDEKETKYLHEGRALIEREKKEGWTFKKFRRKGGIVPTVQEGVQKAVKEFIKARAGAIPLAREKRRERLERLREKLEREEEITDEEWREYEEAISEIRERRERGEEVGRRFVEELLEKPEEEERPPRRPRRRPPPRKGEKPKPPPEEKRPPEKKPPGTESI